MGPQRHEGANAAAKKTYGSVTVRIRFELGGADIPFIRAADAKRRPDYFSRPTCGARQMGWDAEAVAKRLMRKIWFSRKALRSTCTGRALQAERLK